MVFKKKIPVEMSVYLKYLHQDNGIPIKRLAKRFKQYSQATIYRHAHGSIHPTTKNTGPKKRGRKSILTDRDEIKLLLEIGKLRETEGNFTAKRIKQEAGLTGVSDRTVRQTLNKNGYHYLQARKKGTCVNQR